MTLQQIVFYVAIFFLAAGTVYATLDVITRIVRWWIRRTYGE